MAGTNVVYKSTSVQTANVFVNTIQHETIPKKTMNKYPVVRSHRSKLMPPSYYEREITIKGKIIGTSIDNVNTRADQFKAAMNPVENTGNLDIDYASGTRRYVATIVDCQVFPADALFGRDFTLVFVCVDPPWGTDTSSATILNVTSQTTTPISHAITIGGNAIEQVPVITYTLNSFSGAAFNTIYFKNPISGQEISVARTWVAADVILITPDLLSIKVNGTEVDYDGAFPSYIPGAGTLVIRDNFTARNYNALVTQLYRWW